MLSHLAEIFSLVLIKIQNEFYKIFLAKYSYLKKSKNIRKYSLIVAYEKIVEIFDVFFEHNKKMSPFRGHHS